MLTRFTLTPDSTEQGQKLLICSTQDSFLTIIQRQPGQEITLDYTPPVYSAFYGAKDGMLIVHFTVTAAFPIQEETSCWSDELILEAVKFYNQATGLQDLMMVHQHEPLRVLYESGHSLLKQSPEELPAFLYKDQEDGFDTSGDLFNWLRKEE